MQSAPPLYVRTHIAATQVSIQEYQKWMYYKNGTVHLLNGLFNCVASTL